jgi:hypothetical protein
VERSATTELLSFVVAIRFRSGFGLRSGGRVFGFLQTFFATTKESNSVVTPCGLHSGLRQSCTGLWPGFYGMAEAMPLTKPFLPQQRVYV